MDTPLTFEIAKSFIQLVALSLPAVAILLQAVLRLRDSIFTQAQGNNHELYKFSYNSAYASFIWFGVASIGLFTAVSIEYFNLPKAPYVVEISMFISIVALSLAFLSIIYILNPATELVNNQGMFPEYYRIINRAKQAHELGLEAPKATEIILEQSIGKPSDRDIIGYIKETHDIESAEEFNDVISNNSFENELYDLMAGDTSFEDVEELDSRTIKPTKIYSIVIGYPVHVVNRLL